jgi:hypothetical protein
MARAASRVRGMEGSLQRWSLFVGGGEQVGEVFFVLGLGGFGFGVGEGMRRRWRADAVAGVGFDRFDDGEGFFPGLGHGGE